MLVLRILRPAGSLFMFSSHVEGPTIEREFRLCRTICSESWLGFPAVRGFFCLSAAGKTWTPATSAGATLHPLKTGLTRQKFPWDALGYPRRGDQRPALAKGQVITGIAR